MQRINFSSGTPWEPLVGYSRLVRVGRRVFVTGTTATLPDGGRNDGDGYAQTRQALANIEQALKQVGARLEDIVRTRMFVRDIRRDWEAVGRAHAEVLGHVGPATTMVEVNRLIEDWMLVEIEADALVGADAASPTANARPPFIVAPSDLPEEAGQYPDSDEILTYCRLIGKRAGLQRIGLHLERLPPGHRTSWPHAEEKEEEFVFILEGEVDAWVDGWLHRMTVGELAAFPAGTGISHTFINNGARDALLLVGGERSKPDNRIFYPLDPVRRSQIPWSEWWDDAPARPLGPHDGLPDARRARESHIKPKM